MQSGDAAFKDLLSSVVDTNSWAEAKDFAVGNVSATREQLRSQEIMTNNITDDIAKQQTKLQQLQAMVLQWEEQQQQKQVRGLSLFASVYAACGAAHGCIAV